MSIDSFINDPNIPFAIILGGITGAVSAFIGAYFGYRSAISKYVNLMLDSMEELGISPATLERLCDMIDYKVKKEKDGFI